MVNLNSFSIKNNILNFDSKVNIDSIIIDIDGKIESINVKNNLHELRSCSKLLVAMAIGIAIDRKFKVLDEELSLDTKIYPIIEKIVNIKEQTNLNKIQQWTLRNLLTHTTGYEKQMLSEKYIANIDKDYLLDYALNYNIPYEVGNRFAYNNVEPFIISVFFQEAFKVNLCDFINTEIFQKLDITEYRWDNYGKYCPGATGLYLKHEDFHKLGRLLLNDGMYNNIEVVPREWILEMTKIQLETPSIYKCDRVLPKIGAGYFTFISRDEIVFRDGSNGQYIIVNKKDKMLLTIMSSEKEMKNVTEILRGLI